MLPTVRVRLLDVPVALFRAADAHTHDLLREVALIAAARTDEATGHEFGRLLATVEAYAHPAALHRRIAASVAIASGAGLDSVDVNLDADPSAADAALQWSDVLRRFDAMSRDDLLLTMPAAPEVQAFRAWYVEELVGQIRTGREPVPWSARHRVLAGATG